MKILVFTGAGISQESGLKTFRDSDGLWEGFRPEDVCTREAWRSHPERVLSFYNDRRREILAASPNEAHGIIAGLEREHDVTVVTQNVDDLHERAGSSRIIHLHGSALQKRPEENPYERSPWGPGEDDLKIGDIDSLWGQYRPAIVFFDEDVYGYEEAIEETRKADICFVVGTTLAVFPAANVPIHTTAKRVYVVDPSPPPKVVLYRFGRQVHYIRQRATEGVQKAVEWMNNDSSHDRGGVAQLVERRD